MSDTNDRNQLKPSEMQSPYAISKPVWHELPASRRYIRNNGWELRPLPEELMALPDGMVLPEKFQQILTWSLVPGSNWSTQVPAQVAQSANTGSQEQPAASDVKAVESHTEAQSDNIIGGSIPGNGSTYSLQATRSQAQSITSNAPVEGEKSLRSKLLAKIKLGRSEGRLSPELPATAECTSCFEELPEAEMIRLKSCRHWYCRECLVMLITTAIASEITFPPKCCLSPIPLKQILKALNAQQREEYSLKASEYTVPVPDRWYCPGEDCRKWIPKSKLRLNRDLGYNCPHCSARLCRHCRGPAHTAGSECPQDFGLEATLETAEIEGWQRCYSCRAMVEHNRGCRHMTCRCRAEFCYVCGLRWQTCACTETDAANKRAGVEQRRQARAAQVDEEAAEMARVIAEIEEMERREAEERVLAEERRQREEEELLIRLEAERVAEEQRRREAAEQAERELRITLTRSFEDEWAAVQIIYSELTNFQLQNINQRHESEDIRLGQAAMNHKEVTAQEFERHSLILQKNFSKRKARLANDHKVEVEQLEAKQEEEEDDMFMQVQLRLRGKSNKESRMERMLNEIHKQQEEERNELEDKHQKEIKALDGKIGVDKEGLQRWHDVRVETAASRSKIALQKFGYTVGADRHYFDIVLERRNKMLALHAQKFLASIEAAEDPIGLTEYEASLIEPALPEFDVAEEGPSGISRQPTLTRVSRPTPPQSGLRFYEQQQAHVPLNDRREYVSSLKIETQSLYPGQPSVSVRRLSQPAVPGSFPVDAVTTSPYPPPPPSMAPPPIPQSQPTTSPLLLTVPPLNIRGSKTPAVPQSLVPPPTTQFTSDSSSHFPVNSTPSSSPRRGHMSASSTAMVSVATLAASVALSGASSGRLDSTSTTSSSLSHNSKTSAASITSISSAGSVGSGGVSPLSAELPKKSRWGFKRTSDEDVQRKMRGNSLAEGWNIRGVAVGN